MKLTRRIQRFYFVLRAYVVDAAKRLKLEWRYQQFLSGLGTPGYYTRTEKEHEEIRKRLAKDPAACSHLKGRGVYSARAFRHTDYNVSRHIFPDGTDRIRCNSCGQKWFKGQPGWDDALKMTEQSTNKMSSSEVVARQPQKIVFDPSLPSGTEHPVSLDTQKFTVVFQDKLELDKQG